MTTQMQDDTSRALMQSSVTLAESTPDMMAERLMMISTLLQEIYIQAVPDGNAELTAAFEELWHEIEEVHALGVSQASGVGMVALVATAFKMQRDEAMQEVGRLTAALAKIGVLKEVS